MKYGSLEEKTYQEINSKVIDSWCRDGWEWGTPIDHETFLRAKEGDWNVLLTTTKPVPHSWLGDLKGKRILGLASGGGQQMAVFSALGAKCTVFDYSGLQCESDRLVAEREGYEIEVIQGDMTKPLPFGDETFDLVFHPVSNCYIREVEPVFKEVFRVLKNGGSFLGGYDIGINYAFNEDETELCQRLPYDPVSDPSLLKELAEADDGIQFSHTIDEQIGGQLKAGFTLKDIYSDTNGAGNLHDHNVPSFIATWCVKQL